MAGRERRAWTRAGLSMRRRGLVGALSALVAAGMGHVQARRASAAKQGDAVIFADNYDVDATTALTATLSVSDVAFSAFNPMDAWSNAVAIEVNGLKEKLPAPVPSGELAGGVRARGGDAQGQSIGGFGIVPSGGYATSGDAGVAAFCIGGDSLDWQGGVGATFRGADPGGAMPGVGLYTMGGSAVSGPGGPSGEGLVALGGATSIEGSGGIGLVAFGGDADGKDATGGIGLEAYGGISRGGEGTSGVGLWGFGGGKSGREAAGIVSENLSTTGLGPPNPGVSGINAGAGAGVLGQSSDVIGATGTLVGAVQGVSAAGPGGLFESAQGVGLAAVGVGGGLRAYSTAESALVGASKDGAGIEAASTEGVGCDARSDKTFGGQFESGNAATAALVAWNSQAAGGAAGNGARGLFVNGNLVVNGVKSAAVRTSRGMSLLYCLEAPVALFEDFGTAQIVNGRARVDLDPHFLETIDARAFQVLLTARGDTAGVYVSAQDAAGFEIRTRRVAAEPILVDFRVVARRKGLPDAHRLATFMPPAAARPIDARWTRRPDVGPVPTRLRRSPPPIPPSPAPAESGRGGPS